MSSLALDVLETAKMYYQEAGDIVTWRAALFYGGLCATTWVLYHALVQPLLSPLRKMPGTSFNPIFGDMKALMTGEAMEASLKLVNEYGPLMRYYFMFGRERVIVADPDVLKHITVTNCKNFIKPPSRLYMMKMLLGDGLVMSEGSKHEAHKRLMSPFFNNTSVKKMVGVFDQKFNHMAKIWMANISKQGGKCADILVGNDLCRNTLDIIGLTAFGYEFNSLDNPDHEIAQAFQRVLQGTGLSWRFLIPYYFKAPLPDVNKIWADVMIMRNAVDGIIEKKSQILKEGHADETFSKDVLGMMMLAKDDQGRGMTEEELRDQVMTTMLAGHETTAQAISWMLLMLAQHPEVQERARAEVLSVWSSESDPLTADLLDKMNYCDCIVKETLRLFPTVPMTLRESLNDDVFTLGGESYFIPKGTIMLLTIGPMMRRSEFFEDPETFKPDRFFDLETEKTFYRFIPFLIGPRMCLGYKFALMEMKASLAVLLRGLMFETIPGKTFKRKMRTTMRPDPVLELRVSTVEEM